MSLATDLRAYLAARAGLTAIVGGNIFVADAPRNKAGNTTVTLPYVVLFRVSGYADYTLAGEGGMHVATYQFSAYAGTVVETEGIAEQLRDALSGFDGTMGSTPIWGTRLVNRQDNPEPPSDGTEKSTYHISQDYEITHKLSEPTYT